MSDTQRQRFRRRRRRHAEPAEMVPEYIPVLVADRPNHLDIIKQALRQTEGSSNVGILTHPYVSETVAEMLSEWPPSLADQTLVIADNGAFQSEEMLPLNELFDFFDKVADYGIVPDTIGDRQRTEEQAIDAASRYLSRHHHTWSPVAVAHGETIGEYETAYRNLRHLGYEHIAIGGLLEQSGGRSGRHATTSSKMWDTVRRISALAPGGWIFALGCGDGRHERFESLDLAGADGKGWLFEYTSSDTRDIELTDYLQSEILSTGQQTGIAHFIE